MAEQESPNPQGQGQETVVAQQPTNDQAAEQVQDTSTTTQDSGKSQPAFATQLPKDYRHLAEGYDDFGSFMGDVAKAFESKDGVKVPGEDASEEEVAEFFKKLGRPETTDDYELTGELPEGSERDEDLEGWFKETALEANLTKAQAKKLYEKWNERVQGAQQQSQQQIKERQEQVMDQLKEEWGTKTTTNIQQAQKMVKALGGQELVDYLNETGLGDDVRLIKGMYRAAMAVGEDAIESGSIGSDSPGPRRDEMGRPVIQFPNSFPAG
jgi:hypothetical protein